MFSIIGLGPGNPDSLPTRARTLLHSSLPVYLRTARHPTLDALALPNAVAFDDEYEDNPTFEDTYRAIVDRLLRAHETSGDLVYAVPGHPLVGESTVSLLLAETKARNLQTEIIGAPSFVDATLEALGESVTSDLYILDALSLQPDAPVPPPELRVSRGAILLYQVHNQLAASHAKLALMAAGYPDDFIVTVVRAAGTTEQRIETCPLYALDRSRNHDHLTSVWVPVLPSQERRPGYDELVGVMARLRRKPDGCPWDLKQTHQTLRRYVLEEAYEVAEAIDENDPEHLCEELGDLLLQVVFHAQVAAEEGVFDQGDVCAGIVEKMIRRHPHIFGDVKVSNADDVLRNWKDIKAREKNGKEAESVLDGISASLPALAQAMETSRRVVKVGFEWQNFDSVLAKVDEEMQELRAELAAGSDSGRIAAELGDLLFTLVNLARHLEIDPEQALRDQISRFGRRFRFIEAQAIAQNRSIEEFTIDEMQFFWQQAKIEERAVEKES